MVLLKHFEHFRRRFTVLMVLQGRKYVQYTAERHAWRTNVPTCTIVQFNEHFTEPLHTYSQQLHIAAAINSYLTLEIEYA